MTTATLRKPGQFCWINILTPEPTAARAFFTSLLGWSYVEMPGVGHRIQVDGHDIGGIFDLHGPNTPPGTPPVIGVMVKVESADAAAARVTELGGKSLPPFDVMDAGRMAVCFDPDGANIDVWEPRASAGTDVDPMVHGAPGWFEVITGDVPRATAFYSALFGWKGKAEPVFNFTYTTFNLGTDPVAGMMPILPAMGETKPAWSVYFTVTDVDAAARDVVKLGGTVSLEPHDIPNVGRIAGIISPHGVMFYVITYGS